MKVVKKYASGGAQDDPKRAIERRIKELRSEIGVANRSRYATEEQRQQDIAAINSKIKALEAKLAALGK